MINQLALQEKRRLILGFVVAPLVPGLLVGLFSLIRYGSLLAFGLSVCIAFLFGYPVAALLGGPLFLVMQRYRLVKPYYYTVLGGILGLVSGFLAYIEKLQYYSLEDYVHHFLTTQHVLWGAGMGAIATTSFWLIVRPDRLKIICPPGAPFKAMT